MSESDWIRLDDLSTIAAALHTNGAVHIDEPAESWTPLNLAHLPDQPPERPTLGGLGLVYPGKRHVFSGPQESAKTLAAYVIGLEVVRAGEPIILIDFEMGSYDTRNRLRDLGATDAELGRIHYLEPSEPANAERVAGLLALRPALVVVDAAAGAYDLQGLDDNKRQDVERFTRLYVREFWRAEIATIVLDHVVKNTETRGTYAIGSERKVGGADVHLGFSVITPISRGNAGLYKITTHKDRGGYLKRGHLADMALTSDPGTHGITWEIRPAEVTEPGTVWMPTKVMQHISELLQNSNEPRSRNSLITEAGGNKDYAAKAIDHLIRLNYAVENSGPRRAKLVTHERPFTVYEWEHQPDNTPLPPLPPTSPATSPGGTHIPLPPPTQSVGAVGEVVAAENQSLPPTHDWVDLLQPEDTPDEPADLFD